ncbi:FAD-binding protein [Streptomyces sp. NPDC005393]|uniref:FAD-binding protein n=1 Tax=Streptomyces sp. NPDC005393 TaxID=3157041 RepID=UPI0033B27CE1
MSDTAEKAEGRDGWFVDDRCTNCDVARQLAPELIGEIDGRSRMLRQPRDAAETGRLHSAAFACPTRSIRHPGGRLDPALDPFPLELDDTVLLCEWLLPGHGDRRRLAAAEMAHRMRELTARGGVAAPSGRLHRRPLVNPARSRRNATPCLPSRTPDRTPRAPQPATPGRYSGDVSSRHRAIAAYRISSVIPGGRHRKPAGREVMMSGHAQASHIEGTLVERGDAGYESLWASMLWNGLKPARFPDVIVLAASERDVPEAVRLARSRSLRVSVRAGGHSWCGSPLREGAMLIDLSRLRGRTVDPDARTAEVQPGVTGRALVSELARYGLAFPLGHCPSVALGGYLLGGGLGWNPRALGPACAGVLGIEAVTADGEVVSCDAEENPDLFWAARGAGPGFFAVVTRFRLRLYPLPSAITTTAYTFPRADVEPVARWIADIEGELPASVEPGLTLATAGPATSTASPRPTVVSVTATAFADSRQEAVRSLAPLRACPFAERALARKEDEPTSFEAMYDASDAVWPAGHRYAVDTLWSNEDLGTLLALCGDAVAMAPSEKSLVLAPLAPASRNPAHVRNMVFSVLGENYVIPYAVWDDPDQDGANLRWLRRTMDTLEPLGTGHYIAEADLTAGLSRAERSFTPADWERLEALRARYDPEGVFPSYLPR